MPLPISRISKLNNSCTALNPLFVPLPPLMPPTIARAESTPMQFRLTTAGSIDPPVEVTLGKPELLVGVPAGRFQAGINGDKLKGGAMFAVSSNDEYKLYVTIVLLYRGTLKPAATLAVVNATSAQTTKILLDCTWTQPRPSVQLCEWLNDLPVTATPTPTPPADSAPTSAPDSSPTSAPDSAPNVTPNTAPNSASDSSPNSPDSAPDSPLDAAKSMRAVAFPGSLTVVALPVMNIVVKAVYKMQVGSEGGDSAEAVLHYAQ
ncbi:unnamed protein product [Closterium sp. Naga37s-1]|nr:unnamed protein product [Closterium sp. Naga37s-1]